MDPVYYSNSQPHIYFTVITYHIHIFRSHQRKEKREKREENLKRRWRSWCTDRRPAEIEVAERIELVQIGVHQHYLIRRPTVVRPPPHHQTGSDRIVLLLFFFSCLLVLIQLYCKNWILFCILCLDYLRHFLRMKQSQIGLFFPAVVFLFLLFFRIFFF